MGDDNLRFRRLLIDAFAELAGIAAPLGGVSESVFQLESASGVSSFRLSFVRGLSGVEVIVKMLPDQRSAMTLDSVGMNQEQIDVFPGIALDNDLRAFGEFIPSDHDANGRVRHRLKAYHERGSRWRATGFPRGFASPWATARRPAA